MPITTTRVKSYPYTAMAYRGSDGFDKPPKILPLMDIEDYNGKIEGCIFFVIDLVGKNLVNPYIFENDFFLFQKGSLLNEEVTIKDLYDIGVSDLTLKFRKERNKLQGTENKLAKLIEIKLEGKDLIFSWLTEPTENKYSKDHVYYQVNPNTLQLEPNPSKTYLLQISIIDFLDWLNTYPDKKEITTKDIKDIFDVSFIKVFSTSPSFQFQGMNYNLSKLDGSLYPTNIPDNIWRLKHKTSFLDKHLGGLLKSIKFWYSPMASMSTKYLKDNNYLK